MKPFALDTNILIYAHVPSFPEHRAARRFVEEHLVRGISTFYLSWQIVYEYLRIMTHPNVLDRPLTASEAATHLDPYLNNPRCRLLVETDRHRQVLEHVLKTVPAAKGNFMHDCRYAALLREYGVETIVTADLDFRKFGFLDVINPVQN